MKPVEPCLIDLQRPVTPIEAWRTPVEAMHALRSAGHSALPVVDQGRVVGCIGEGDLLVDGPRAVREVMRAAVLASGAEDLATALVRLKAADSPFIAVVDPADSLIGIVSRSDLFSALHGDLRPISIGGLATPLGVYLTTGHHRGGAGDLGLFLAGVLLMGLNVAALYVIQWVARWLPILGHGTPLGFYVSDLGLVAALLTFLGMLRLSRVSGTHAAEHQVVHAIEKGEPLRFERVSIQPREHPRCGTNLAAVALAAQVALPRLVASPLMATLAVVLLFFTWRRLGWAMQRVFTTREPHHRQLEGAIGAGRDLLARYNARPGHRATQLGQVWNTGAAQILLGAVVVSLAESWAWRLAEWAH